MDDLQTSILEKYAANTAPADIAKIVGVDTAEVRRIIVEAGMPEPKMTIYNDQFWDTDEDERRAMIAARRRRAARQRLVELGLMPPAKLGRPRKQAQR